MIKFKGISVIILALVLMVISLGCTNTNSSQGKGSAKTIELTVSAAASLADALEEIKGLYQQEAENVKITYNFASSGTLQQQIEQGAPVDIFFSAATRQMDALEEKGLLLEGTYEKLLENKIVLAVPENASRDLKFEALGDAEVERIAIGDPGSVPAGQYAQEVLTNIKLWEAVEAKAVFARDVREVLTWVEQGEVDAGIVYRTDAQISSKVRIASSAPEGSHKAILYPVAVIKDSKEVEAAKAFVAFFKTPEVQKIFEKYGFAINE